MIKPDTSPDAKHMILAPEAVEYIVTDTYGYAEYPSLKIEATEMSPEDRERCERAEAFFGAAARELRPASWAGEWWEEAASPWS